MSNMSLEELYNLYLKCEGVSIDTRTISKGELFFALKGPNFDGNQKAHEALEKGASYCIVDDINVVRGPRYVPVDNVLQTLQELARLHRSKINVPVLGITGSNGKTTTKELIRDVLEMKYKVASTVGNFNNHIGLPLTLLNQPADADIWILEMGSNAPGNIQELCDIGHPNLGLITNIGFAHIEQLKDQEGVYKEKTDLYRSVERANGVLFINIEDVWLQKYRSQINTILYSSKAIGSLKINEKKSEDYSITLEILEGEELHVIHSALVGSYNIYNISAAIAVGRHFEVPLSDICTSLSNYRPENMRSQVKKTERNTLIIDAYNANPSSMRESILSHKKNHGENLVFILGDMLELGDSSKQFHESILELLLDKESMVITVGALFYSCKNSPDLKFENVETLIESGILQELKQQQVLIKGSRGIKLEKVLSYL